MTRAPHIIESQATPIPQLLEPARAMPCFEGMDDCGDYAQAVGREALEGMLVVECPEACHG